MNVPTFTRGEGLTAVKMNRLAQGVRAGIGAGGGGSGGPVRVIPCRVVGDAIIEAGAQAFPGGAGSAGVAYVPSAITYDVDPLGGPGPWGFFAPEDGEGGGGDSGGPLFAGLSPEMGRPVRGDEAPVHPARSGDLCEVWLVSTGGNGVSGSGGSAFEPRLRILTEAVAIGCEEEGTG